MKTSKFTTAMSALCLIFSQSPLFAQQITQSSINMEPVKTVNFKQLADYEIQHPPLKAKHFIEQGEDREGKFKFRGQVVPAGATTFNVPPVQGAKALVNSPAPSASWNGVMDNGTLIPPDIRGAAGTNYVMQTTNQEFKIYTKSGTLNSTVTITSFFAPTGGSGYFDPHILYDNSNGKWIICIDGNLSNGHGGIFMGVSQTGDPSGAWYIYSFDGIGNTTDFLDYPLLGYNTNWVVVTANDFLGGTNPVGKIYVMNRASLYSGTLGTVSAFTDNVAFTIAPAQTFDNSQTTEYLVQDWNGNSGGNGYVEIGTITGTPSSPSYSAGVQLGVNQPWSETSVGAKQSGSSQTIEDGDTRIGNAVYINGSLWFCQTGFLPATSPTHSAVQWWQVNPSSNTIQQFGRVENTTGPTFYFYPSIAVNSNGDALLGYCQSSSTTFASAAYSFHAGTDAANSMQTNYLYKSGVAGYYKTYGGGRNRWGDYTGAAVDPTDNSFWNFSEWANTSNLWATVICHVPSSVNPCAAQPTGMNTTAIADNSVTFNWTAATGAVSYNIQYRPVGTSTWSTGNSATTSFNASGLTAGTNYEWQVQTVCASGSSAYTASTNFTTTGTALCNAATGMNTSNITSATATFNWTAVTGATGYNIQYRVVGTGTWSTGVSGSASYNASGLTASTNYEWQVQTVCASGSSGFTASTNFTTGASTCTDNYESNNTTGTAKTVAVGVDVFGLINPSTDVDYFAFSNTSSQPKIKVTLTNLPGDYDIRLYKPNGSQAGISQNGGTTPETIIYNTTTVGVYKVKIYGYGGAYSATQCYDFHAYISSSNFAPVTNNDVLASDKETDMTVVADDVIKLFPNPAQDNLNVEFFSTMEGKARMSVYNLTGQKVTGNEGASVEGLNTFNITTNTLSNGIYIFELDNNGAIERRKFTIAK